MLCVHRLREGVKADRTACINRIRGLLLAFGIGVSAGVKVLSATLDDILEDAGNELNGLARVTLQRAQAQWRELDAHLAWCHERLAAHEQDNDDVKRAAQPMGVGAVTASAAVGTVGDFKQSHSGAQFGAWLGLTPKQRSSGTRQAASRKGHFSIYSKAERAKARG
jgi:transposase